MGRSQETFNKKDIRLKKEKKRKEKEGKKLERKASSKDGKSFDDMIAYVDENGNLTSTPPDPTTRIKINADDIEISIPKRSAEDSIDVPRIGIVSFFNDSKGYGFIKDLANQQSVFVHINNVTEAIKENNKVTFDVERGPKGLNAINVKLSK